MALPAGTVTLLFSDMEGSTRLLGRLGQAYGQVLDLQRGIQRRAWIEHHGHELGTEGDSFFVAFPTARDALAAAVQAQRELLAARWPGEESVKVRMGIHTGTPTLRVDHYFGMDVNRAARIAAAAHGGQIVISQATAQAASPAHHLPEGVTFLDLGEHLLKDIEAPERLLQVCAPGLPASFPAPRAQGSPTRVPTPRTTLLGRELEILEITALLDRDDAPLITLTGPGGSGKTRLAIAVASARPSTPSVHFVPLETVTTSDGMWVTVAESLGVPPEECVPAELPRRLADVRALLVLDNLEQIPDAGEMVDALLGAVPGIRIIATSRHPLHVDGEREYAVSPLDLPRSTGLSATRAAGAVRLFEQRAQSVRRDFVVTEENHEAVAAICALLDGLPLAVELAAARVKLLPPAALLARMGDALDFRANDGRRPSRQQTLRQAITWSYHLLDEDARAIFHLAGAFPAGVGLTHLLQIAEHACPQVDALEQVEVLVHASLVTLGESDAEEPRVGMLNTIRAFALDAASASDDLLTVRSAMTRWAGEILREPDEPPTPREYQRLLSLVEEELETFREIVTFAPTLPVRPEPDGGPMDPVTTALELAARLRSVVARSHYAREAEAWCDAALAAAGPRRDPAVAGCLAVRADLAQISGDLPAAHAMSLEAAAMLREAGADSPDGPRHLRRHLGDLLTQLALEAVLMGKVAEARAFLDEVDRQVLWPDGEISFLIRSGYVAKAQGDPLSARAAEREAVEIARRTGRRAYRIEHNLACGLREEGRPEEAFELMSRNVEAFLQARKPLDVLALGDDYGLVLLDLGRFEDAALVIGATTAARVRLAVPRDRFQDSDLAQSLARAHDLSAERWDALLAAGTRLDLEDALRQVDAAASSPVDHSIPVR